MAILFAKTPRFVLKEGAYPTSPSVVQTSAGDSPDVIYGFSDKTLYDHFMLSTSLALTPYPLVNRFLNDQIELEPLSLKLVVLDAASSAERQLHAATFQAVLESSQLGSATVAVTHRLILEEGSTSYRIESSSFSLPAKPSS